MNKKKTKKCAECGKEFKLYHSTDKYCSVECAIANTLDGKLKEVIRLCKECGKEFIRLIPMQRFCSSICAIQNATTAPAKKKKSKVTLKRCLSVRIKQISTKKAKADKILDQNKLKLKSKILDDVGYFVCEHCGKSRCGTHFEIHHIIWRSEEQGHTNLHAMDNLMHVGAGCKDSCHELFHRIKSTRVNYVNDRKLHLLFNSSKYLK